LFFVGGPRLPGLIGRRTRFVTGRLFLFILYRESYVLISTKKTERKSVHDKTNIAPEMQFVKQNPDKKGSFL
jgi:hypothetical protein